MSHIYDVLFGAILLVLLLSIRYFRKAGWQGAFALALLSGATLALGERILPSSWSHLYQHFIGGDSTGSVSPSPMHSVRADTPVALTLAETSEVQPSLNSASRQDTARTGSDESNVIGAISRDEQVRKMGFALPLRTFGDSLPDGWAQDRTLRFQAGLTYAVLGKCDSSCEDFYLSLDTEEAARTDRALSISDTTSGNSPTLMFLVRRTGRYVLRAYVANCSSLFCTYSGKIYSRPSTTDDLQSAPDISGDVAQIRDPSSRRGRITR